MDRQFVVVTSGTIAGSTCANLAGASVPEPPHGEPGADVIHQTPEALIGRESELARVGALLDDDAMTDRALLVSADPGVGKTALLNTAAAEAAANGVRILRAEGVEFEAEVSFSGLNQALLPLLEEFERLGGLHREALSVALGLAHGPPPDRLVVSNAALALLRQVATGGPLLLVIDDLPWLDRSSADVLGFVARRLTGGRVGLVSAARSDAKTFFDGTALPVLQLHPLAPEAANTLLRRRYPTLAPGVRRRLLDVACGNPLALLELPAALSGRQRTSLQSLPAVLPLSSRLQALFEMPRSSRTGDPLGSFSEKVRARASKSTEVLPGVQG